MKNSIYTLFFVLFQGNGISQLQIGYQKGINLWLPYSSDMQEYMKKNDQVSSRVSNAYLVFSMKENSAFVWSSGFCYKYSYHRVNERIKSYYYFDPYNNNSSGYSLKNEPLDFLSTSHAIGVQNNIDKLLKNGKIQHKIGVQNELYFVEFFHSDYVYPGTKIAFDDMSGYAYISPLNATIPSNFLLSSTSLSIYYHILYHAKEKMNVGLKVSVGTNLYSDWDQFKKYAWLGLGLEVGFGKGPLFTKKAN